MVTTQPPGLNCMHPSPWRMLKLLLSMSNIETCNTYHPRATSHVEADTGKWLHPQIDCRVENGKSTQEHSRQLQNCLFSATCSIRVKQSSNNSTHRIYDILPHEGSSRPAGQINGMNFQNCNLIRTTSVNSLGLRSSKPHIPALAQKNPACASSNQRPWCQQVLSKQRARRAPRNIQQKPQITALRSESTHTEA